MTTPTVREFHGTIRGELAEVTTTHGYRALLRPHGGGTPVTVDFPAGLLDDMRRGLAHFVELDGIVQQDTAGTNRHITAEEVRVAPESPVPWRELHGLIPDITDGLPVREYLESIRGDWD